MGISQNYELLSWADFLVTCYCLSSVKKYGNEETISDLNIKIEICYS